ncbi:MAG: hypothetical protein R6V20_04400 [Desulfobia sp.]
MEAIEFKAKVKNGIIHIPRKYSQKIGDSVKVIILSDSPEKEGDLVEELLQNPIKLGSFPPVLSGNQNGT